ncbi:MAG: APC family permease [Actinobacteria bacterium]|nr:APC family permease [Actinomycetota bacterium]NDH13177.1 APC family permease [Actinomycetota bacterium]
MEDSQKQSLERGLGFKGLLSLAISDITPMASLLVTAGAVLYLSGTASVWAFALGCLIAVTVAMSMAELGSMYPTAGGLFYIIHKVLGRPVGFVAMVDYVLQGIFIPATLALGLGTYLHALIPSVPVNASAAIAMVIITVLAVLRIHISAVIVTVCLAIEGIVLALIIGVGLFNLNQPLSILTDPVMLVDGKIGSVAGAAIVAAIASSLFSVNGYDSAINFSEEVKGNARNIGRAVMYSALVGVVLELTAFTFGLFGTRDLNSYLSSATPFTDAVTTALGKNAGQAVLVGALFAIINATLAITLQFARVLWASGRDKAWPHAMNEFLGQVHPKFRSPWAATVIIGLIATIFCMKSSLISTVTFTAVLIILLYALIAIAALVSRIKNKTAERPFKMMFWPIPPIITILGVSLTLTKQKTGDLKIILIIVLVSLAYYYLYLNRSKHELWVPHNPAKMQ